MAYTPESPNWTPITNSDAYQITCSTRAPGYVYPYATGNLPAPLQKLPGISDAYISGYESTYKDVKGVEVRGEFVVNRSGEGTGKGYVYFFGTSASTVHFAGPYKPYDGHYFDPNSAVPLEKLFGQSPPPNPSGGQT